MPRLESAPKKLQASSASLLVTSIACILVVFVEPNGAAFSREQSPSYRRHGGAPSPSLRRRATPKLPMAVMSIPTLEPHVIKSACSSVAELLTCCGIGVAANRLGLLTPKTTSALASGVYNIFLPSMLSTSVASTVAKGMSGSMMALPLAAWVQVAIGLFSASVCGKLMRIPSESNLQQEVSVLSAFGNSGVLPLIFADALFSQHPDKAILPMMNALVALYLLGWSPVFWTVGFALLSGSAELKEGDSAKDSISRIPQKLRLLLSKILTPPIIGCLAGLMVGLVPPLRALLLPSASGEQSALPLYRCLRTFGKAYAPSAVLVLAGSFAAGSNAADSQDTGTGASNMLGVLPARGLIAIGACRFLLVPLLSFLSLSLTHRLGLLKPDPMCDFLIMTQAIMPSAQNSVLALQVTSKPRRATRMARTLLFLYLIATLPVSLLLTVLLQRSGLAIPAS